MCTASPACAGTGHRTPPSRALAEGSVGCTRVLNRVSSRAPSAGCTSELSVFRVLNLSSYLPQYFEYLCKYLQLC